MRFLGLVVGWMLGFFAVLGLGVTAFGLAMTGGGVAPDDLSAVKEGIGKAYVAGLKGVEQTARRLRGAYCAGEQGPAKSANCG